MSMVTNKFDLSKVYEKYCGDVTIKYRGDFTTVFIPIFYPDGDGVAVNLRKIEDGRVFIFDPGSAFMRRSFTSTDPSAEERSVKLIKFGLIGREFEGKKVSFSNGTLSIIVSPVAESIAEGVDALAQAMIFVVTCDYNCRFIKTNGCNKIRR